MHHSRIFFAVAALSVMASLAHSAPPAHDAHAGHAMPPAASAASQDYMAGMERMNREMNVPMTGNADRDFAAMMIPHHLGAIDMAKVQLKYGRDPMLRKMARDIIKAQETEIAQLKGWLSKNK